MGTPHDKGKPPPLQAFQKRTTALELKVLGKELGTSGETLLRNNGPEWLRKNGGIPFFDLGNPQRSQRKSSEIQKAIVVLVRHFLSDPSSNHVQLGSAPKHRELDPERLGISVSTWLQRGRAQPPVTVHHAIWSL